MPRGRTSMEKIREIIRLHECHLTARAISRAIGVSRPVVKEYIDKIRAAELDSATIQNIDDDTLTDLIKGSKNRMSERFQLLSSHFDYFALELKRPGVTLERLWAEYRAAHPPTSRGYSYSQFCYHFQLWRSTSELTMHLEHKAGDKMFVDFAGKKLHITDRMTGEITDVEVFVAILAASQYTYVEAVPSQQKADFISATQNAYHYFGGVPHTTVPDCLKSAVTKSCKYEPDINPEYSDMASHYQTVILPARPGRPKDKALVEGAVRIVYNWIYAALRNRIFTSLQELNQAIREELETYNAKPMQKLGVSRKAQFDHIEKAALLPLPTERYITRKFKSLKVHFNYHIYLSDDKHHYSVPYRYRAQQVKVIYTDSVVEIFHKNQRIAFHKRNRKTPNGYTTTSDHMPERHRRAMDWNPQRLIDWAATLGEYVQAVVTTTLRLRHHPEQAYKTCLGILSLAKKYDKERLNKACKIAIHFQHYSYKGIKNIIDNKLENQQLDCFETPPNRYRQDHQNIRGIHYYNQKENIV